MIIKSIRPIINQPQVGIAKAVGVGFGFNKLITYPIAPVKAAMPHRYHAGAIPFLFLKPLERILLKVFFSFSPEEKEVIIFVDCANNL